MKNKIVYLIFFILLVSFIFIGFEMGKEPSSYGEVSQAIVDKTVVKTGSINSVTATVFDFRGYDTLGEAVVLFTAICGVSAVLRSNKKEEGRH